MKMAAVVLAAAAASGLVTALITSRLYWVYIGSDPRAAGDAMNAAS
jgi:hypothetical protein